MLGSLARRARPEIAPGAPKLRGMEKVRFRGFQTGRRVTGVPAKGYPYLAEADMPGPRVQVCTAGDPFDDEDGLHSRAYGCTGSDAMTDKLSAVLRELVNLGVRDSLVDGVVGGGAGVLTFTAFDLVRLDDLHVHTGPRNTQMTVAQVPQRLRREALEFLLGEEAQPMHPIFQLVHLAEQRVVSTPEEAEGELDGFMLAGFRGMVLKQPGASYIVGETSAWTYVGR